MTTPNVQAVKTIAVVGLVAYKCTMVAYTKSKEQYERSPATGICCVCCFGACAMAEAGSIFMCMEACVPAGVFIAEMSTWIDLVLSPCGELCHLDDGAPSYKEQTWAMRCGCEKIPRSPNPKVHCFKPHEDGMGPCKCFKISECAYQLFAICTEPIKASIDIGEMAHIQPVHSPCTRAHASPRCDNAVAPACRFVRIRDAAVRLRRHRHRADVARRRAQDCPHDKRQSPRRRCAERRGDGALRQYGRARATGKPSRRAQSVSAQLSARGAIARQRRKRC